MPHQTHWLYKVIRQPATFPLNRPWNWLSRSRCYYLDVFHLRRTTFNDDMKAGKREHCVFFCIIQTHFVIMVKLQAALPASTSSTLSFSFNPNDLKSSPPPGNSPWKLFQGGQGWNLTSESQPQQDASEEEQRKKGIIFYKWAANGYEVQPFHLFYHSGDEENEEQDTTGVKGMLLNGQQLP